MASKKKASRKKKSGGNASEFIRGMPTTLKAADVVAAGKKKGISFTPGLVYIVRGRVAGKAGGPAKAGKRGPKRGRAAAASSSDAQFRRLVVELGVTRAKALLNEVERGMAALIQGG